MYCFDAKFGRIFIGAVNPFAARMARRSFLSMVGRVKFEKLSHWVIVWRAMDVA